MFAGPSNGHVWGLEVAIDDETASDHRKGIWWNSNGGGMNDPDGWSEVTPSHQADHRGDKDDGSDENDKDDGSDENDKDDGSDENDEDDDDENDEDDDGENDEDDDDENDEDRRPFGPFDHAVFFESGFGAACGRDGRGTRLPRRPSTWSAARQSRRALLRGWNL
ncbi:MAG: hypothetical protein J7M25_06745 [Deltaproteobacteria bacterium]|nr:hypothetical protein [Deltaproteobacteria bacterium]